MARRATSSFMVQWLCQAGWCVRGLAAELLSAQAWLLLREGWPRRGRVAASPRPFAPLQCVCGGGGELGEGHDHGQREPGSLVRLSRGGNQTRWSLGRREQLGGIAWPLPPSPSRSFCA